MFEVHETKAVQFSKIQRKTSLNQLNLKIRQSNKQVGVSKDAATRNVVQTTEHAGNTEGADTILKLKLVDRKERSAGEPSNI